MSNDATLLRRYVTNGSEADFAELVSRHVDLVHSAALRQLGGDLHGAQDVTQWVFCELARKAPRLLEHRSLSGWLYTTARFAAARRQRADRRRLARELNSQTMTPVLDQSSDERAWRDLQPVLDDAMQELSAKDRHAIVLRFFEDKRLAEVGVAVGLTENAARMRVDRAIEKLRSALARRGVTSTSSMLGSVLVAHAIMPAPSGLAATVVGPALAGAAAGSATGFTATIAAVHIMNSAKLGITVAALAIAGAAGTYVTLNRSNQKLQSDLASLRQQMRAPSRVGNTDHGGQSQVDADELAGLRAEHSELLRLRGEVGVLKLEKAGAVRRPTETQAREVPQISEEQAREVVRNLGIAKMNFVKAWGLALQTYALTNGGAMPETFRDAARFFPPIPEEWKWSVASFSPDDFEIVYHGSLSDLEHPERTILLREKEPFDVQDSGAARRTYLFADGHSEVHRAADGNFESWEGEHIAVAAQ